MSSKVVVLLLLTVLNYSVTSANKLGKNWIPNAFNRHHDKIQKKMNKMKGMMPEKVLLGDSDMPDIDEALMMKEENILNEDDYENNPFDNPMEMHDFETQHSFQSPVDMISQNWQFFGDAVATSNFARLTPNKRGRKGILWNKFAVHLHEWQITLEVNIHSDSHRMNLGGDGFAIFLLNENDIKRQPSDTANIRNVDLDNVLLGDFYGLRSDFNGTAIVFDTYDNDNNGDNPLVFSLTNNAQKRNWDFENDLQNARNDDRKRHNDVNVPGVPNAFSIASRMHQMKRGFDNMDQSACSLDLRERGSVKILIRYQNNELHIYTDLNHQKKKDANPIFGGLGKFGGGGFFPFAKLNFQAGNEDALKETPHLCMITHVALEELSPYHIAISAMTGDIADNHDILKMETKYIRKDHLIDDGMFEIQEKKERNRSGFVFVFWIVICVFSIGLLFETFWEIYVIRKMYFGNKNFVECINNLNPFIQMSYVLNLVQFILLIFAFNWKCLLCNSPLLLIRAHNFMTNNVSLTPHRFELPVFLYKTTYKQWIYVQLILLSLSAFYHFWRLFHI